VNHPLDCPVCDKGGECPLQDQTLAYGPGETRFVEEKRHWAKPIPISELILLDRERCIQCGRCVRFAAEIAGEAQIDFLDRGDRTEVNIFENEPMSPYFSGNVAQICPVGALNTVPYRFTARPWDLEQVESTCTTCSVGCRVAVQSSGGKVTRILGMDSEPVNQSWLCDKGRFGYEAIEAESRVLEPMLRRGKHTPFEPVSWAEALGEVSERLGAALRDRGPEGIGVIGGARLTNESAYAWARLAKGVLRTDSVDAQLGDGLPAELVLALPRASISAIDGARAVILLAGDLREELPVLYLRLRGAALRGVPIVELSAVPTALTKDATASLRLRPGEQASLVRSLVEGAGAPVGVDRSQWAAAMAAIGTTGAAGAGAPLEEGEGIVVVFGRPSLAESDGPTSEAVALLAASLPKARFLPSLRRGNVMGALDMGLAPGVLPGRVTLQAGSSWFEGAWGGIPAKRGRSTTEMLELAAEGGLGALVLLGADPIRDFPDAALARRALEHTGFVLAVDTTETPSSSLADAILPAATVHERGGTTTNIEGRVSRLARKVVAPGQAWSDWTIASEIAYRLGSDFGISSVVELRDEIERLASSHAGLSAKVTDDIGERDGIIVPLKAAPSDAATGAPASTGHRTLTFDPIAVPGIEAVERQGAPPRAAHAEPLGTMTLAEAIASASFDGAGRPERIVWPVEVPACRVPPLDGYSLRLVSGRKLYDTGVLVESSQALSAFAGRLVMRAHPQDLARIGVESGSPVRVRSARAAILVEAAADDAVPRGAAVADFNVEGGSLLDVPEAPGGGGNQLARAADLIDVGETVTDIRLETP
jgi:NADH-quinone oxidoreductase subunit G